MHGMPEWQTFWDLADPQRAATILAELYGDAAATAAADCAATARTDERDDDYRFWIAVQARLQAAQRDMAESDEPWLENPTDRPPALT